MGRGLPVRHQLTCLPGCVVSLFVHLSTHFLVSVFYLLFIGFLCHCKCVEIQKSILVYLRKKKQEEDDADLKKKATETAYQGEFDVFEQQFVA